MTEGSLKRSATVTTKGQVTIPLDVRRALGLKEGGGPVLFVVDNGVVTVSSAYQPSLTELLAGFDPEKHRHSAEERSWDDAPRGRETL